MDPYTLNPHRSLLDPLTDPLKEPLKEPYLGTLGPLRNDNVGTHSQPPAPYD